MTVFLCLGELSLLVIFFLHIVFCKCWQLRCHSVNLVPTKKSFCKLSELVTNTVFCKRQWTVCLDKKIYVDSMVMVTQTETAT